MFGQWHTVVVSHWCLANGIQLLLTIAEVQIVMLDAGHSETCAVTRDVTSQKADGVTMRNVQIIAASRNWYSWIQSCGCKYKDTAYLIDKTNALPVPYRAPQRTLKYYENYDISLLICKTSVAAKWGTSLTFMSSCIIIIFKYISNKTQRYTVYFIWKLLYMFRVVPPPIISRANNCIYSIWYLSHRYCYLPL